MPIVHINMFKGRTLEQRREMVREVTDSIVKTLKCDEEAVRIIVNELEKEDLSVGGVLRSDKEKGL